MIGIELRAEHKEGISPAYAEVYGRWVVNTPITEDEYRRFAEEMDKAKEMGKQIYLKSNGLVDFEKFLQKVKS